MKKKHKIVMLPTADVAPIGGLVSNGEELIIVDNNIFRDNPRWQPQHLYILSDDEIKEGDWVYHANRSIEQWKSIHDKIYDRSLRKKIIATTDPKLQVDNVLNLTLEKFGKKHLPQIPQSLIEYYAKHQPEEVELEYEYVEGAEFNTEKGWNRTPLRLKLQNNEVVWVENLSENPDYKLYTREEVEKLCREAARIGAGHSNFTLEQWLKENL